MKAKLLILVLAITVAFTGCRREEYDSNHSLVQLRPDTEPALSVDTNKFIPVQEIETVDLVPEEDLPDRTLNTPVATAEKAPRQEGDRLSYTIKNVWAEDKLYDITVSGVFAGDYDGGTVALDTARVGEKLYTDLRLDLSLEDKELSTLKINISSDDRFLLLESAVDGLEYGYEVFSSKNSYGTTDFPDILMLDFFIRGVAEAPQYTRFFAIQDSEIKEIPIYYKGAEVAPFGAHMRPLEAGKLYNELVLYNGYRYGMEQYHYTFDVANWRMVRIVAKVY